MKSLLKKFFWEFPLLDPRNLRHNVSFFKILILNCFVDRQMYPQKYFQWLFPPPIKKQFKNNFFQNDYSEIENLACELDNAFYLKASVIVASYNQKETLKLNLLGWAQQDYPKDLFEVIVADDGSSDGTEGMVSIMREVVPYSLKFCTHADKGFRLAKARNEGVALSDGEVVVFVDSDTIPCPEYLREHMKYYHVSNRVAVIGMRHRINGTDVNEDKINNDLASLKRLPMLRDRGVSPEKWKWRKNILFNNLEWRKQTRVFGGFHGTLGSCRKEDFIGVGGNDETFIGYGQEDSEFAFRLMGKVQYLISNPKARIFHIEHLDSSGASSPQNIEIFKKKTRHPLVSILIVLDGVFANPEPFLSAINSQTMQDIEIIIVNRSSSEEAKRRVEALRYDPQIRIFNEPKKSKGAALNLASLYSLGKYVCITTPEAMSSPEILAKLVEKIDNYIDVAFVYPVGNSNKRIRVQNETVYKFRGILQGNIPSFPWLIRKYHFIQTSGFVDNSKPGVEFDIALKVEELGKVVPVSISDQSMETTAQTSFDLHHLLPAIADALKRRDIPVIVDLEKSTIILR